MPKIILQPNKEKSVLKHHPWIFSGSIRSIDGKPGIGEVVEVLSSEGDFIARASYNPQSNIAARIWTWDINEQVDEKFFTRKIKQAIECRQKLSPFIESNAFRLIHAESDGLPGLILDKYAEICVVQFLTAGIDVWKETLVPIIKRYAETELVYERSDVDVRQLEGLPQRTGLLWGDEFQNPAEIIESGLKYKVDFVHGHKTGFYLDQRDNRLFVRKISADKKVLDCFSYTGGFTMNCLAGGAKHVTLVDSSEQALTIAHTNLEINNFNLQKVNFIEEDVFKYLRTLRDKGETFDLIILDPPKLAPTISQVERAARAYKDINLLALKLLSPGGYLFSFSCSGGVSQELFQQIITGAAQDARVEASILATLHQAVDHPVALNFPEGKYLKGFLIQKGYKY